MLETVKHSILDFFSILMHKLADDIAFGLQNFEPEFLGASSF